MIEIIYRGGSSLVISNSSSKLIINPNRQLVGLDNLDVNGLVQVATESNLMLESKDSVLNIDQPGEYEVLDFSVKGFEMKSRIDAEGTNSTSYLIRSEGFKIAMVANVDEDSFDQMSEELALVDVLILPVGGGGYTLDFKMASKLVKLIEPKVVVPIHYAESKLKYEVPQDDLELFEKEVSLPVQAADSLKLRRAADLPEELSLYKLKLVI